MKYAKRFIEVVLIGLFVVVVAYGGLWFGRQSFEWIYGNQVREIVAECDRLNRVEVPPPFSITFTDSTVTTYEFSPEDYHHLLVNVADIHARKEAEHE